MQSWTLAPQGGIRRDPQAAALQLHGFSRTGRVRHAGRRRGDRGGPARLQGCRGLRRLERHLGRCRAEGSDELRQATATRAACACSGPSGRNICLAERRRIGMSDSKNNVSLKPRRSSAAKPTELPARDAGAVGNETLATALYRSLKKDIIRGALTPREWLRIDVLRERYGAGASPLREALNRLSAEGLVVQHDQRGFVVADVDRSGARRAHRSRAARSTTSCCRPRSRAATRPGKSASCSPTIICRRRRRSPRTAGVNDEYQTRHREFHMSILAPCGSRWLLELSEKLFDWTAALSATWRCAATSSVRATSRPSTTT